MFTTMTNVQRVKVACCIVPALVGLVTPPAVRFCVEVFAGGIAPMRSLGDMAHRYLDAGGGMALLVLLDLVPFVILVGVLATSWPVLAPRRVYGLLVGGLIGVLAVMVPAHVGVWYPLYTGGPTSSTAVLAFLFIPWLCVPGMLAGLAVGWAVSLLAWFGPRDQGTREWASMRARWARWLTVSPIDTGSDTRPHGRD